MPVHEAAARGGDGSVKAAGSSAPGVGVPPRWTARSGAVAEGRALMPASADATVAADDPTASVGDATGVLHGFAMAMPMSAHTSTATETSTRRRRIPPSSTTCRNEGGSVISLLYAFNVRTGSGDYRRGQVSQAGLKPERGPQGTIFRASAHVRGGSPASTGERVITRNRWAAVIVLFLRARRPPGAPLQPFRQCERHPSARVASPPASASGGRRPCRTGSERQPGAARSVTE